jgi:hypothetical protein
LAAVLKDTLTSRDPAPISNDEVIELTATFAIDSPELRAYGTEGIQIIDGGQLTAQSASLATLLAELGVKASSYRDLLDKLPTNT